MTRMEVNGLCLNVEVRGQGPPLVLLHGFTGSARTWDAHVQKYAGGYTTVAIDLPGHGLSDSPAEPERYRMERVVEDVARALDVLDVERAAALGYSMGGRLALHLGLRLPERLTVLLLEGASPGMADPAERCRRVERDEALASCIEQDGVPAFVERWAQNPLFATQRALPEGMRASLRSQRLSNSAVGLANSLRGMGTGAQEPLHRRLPELAVPVLLVAGELDTRFSKLAGEMAAVIPHARLEIVPGAGHAVHLERPEEFDRIVMGFLPHGYGT